MKAFHYRVQDWLNESPVIRAELIAHEFEKGMRDAWAVEHNSDKGGKPGAGGNAGSPVSAWVMRGVKN